MSLILKEIYFIAKSMIIIIRVRENVFYLFFKSILGLSNAVSNCIHLLELWK